MGKSKISWTEYVWNPVVGCSRIAHGCMHCYAETMTRRLAAMGRMEYKNLLTSDHRWNGRVRCLEQRLDDPLQWRKPRRIFVCSMGDLFHNVVTVDFIASVYARMEKCSQHIFIVLTKRAERAAILLQSDGPLYWMLERIHHLDDIVWPLPNVWHLGSVSTQADANEIISHVLDTPAAIRGVSLEPLLGPVDLTRIKWAKIPIDPDNYRFSAPAPDEYNKAKIGLDWVIVGGESGPGARPMHPDWARSIRDQCQDAGVAFYFKQWGEWTSEFPQERSLAHIQEAYRDGQSYWRVGKKAAGRLLDGQLWDEYPETSPPAPLRNGEGRM